MKSKTLIEKQLKKKSNPEIVETIIAAKKKKNWLEIAHILSGPRKKHSNINLQEIEKQSKDNDTIVIPGKVLSQGELNKKIKVVAFKFSEKAKEKIIKSGSKVLSILEEIKLNPEAKGVKIIK
ncbi:MAG TPA: 50S ribosomal protein L18e [Candidatus Nanoarchaeia archaeon]|nr:50S ribosomal protein L18e [Candidatus Nanoarchaeia archaeon]